jgi:hypothetical protein
MTHLHFDHCGGSVQWNRKKQATNLTKTPNFGVMKATGNGAKPNPRGFFFVGNILMQESGQLNFIKRRRRLSRAIRTGVWDFLC